jgi:hypothetical protein
MPSVRSWAWMMRPPPSRARKAQKDWAATAASERDQLVKAGVARLGEMSDEIVPELAWMMGRPVRYGGEFGGVNERATTWPRLPREALAPIEIEDSGLRAPDRARAAWRGLRHRAVELPLHDRDQHGRSGADRRQHGGAQARNPDAAGGRTHGPAFSEAGLPEDVFQNLFLDHRTHER